MTAEIGILNKSGVALAADSAVTFGGGRTQKVYNSANKLFSLSKNHPIGIMIYGSSTFMGIPWETIIKYYRHELGEIKFDKLSNYCENFLEFLNTNQLILQNQDENAQVATSFDTFLSSVLNKADKIIEKFDAQQKEDENEVKEILLNSVQEVNDELIKAHDLSSNYFEHFEHEFILKHESTLKSVVDNNIYLKLEDEEYKCFYELASNFFSRNILADSYSGIVISGYGETEIFPSMFEYMIEGSFLNRLKFVQDTDVIIGNKTASVNAFAQKEMVNSFMSGVEPKLEDAINNILATILNNYIGLLDYGGIKLNTDQQETVKNINKNAFAYFQDELFKIQKDQFIDPILDIVELLPKEELAEMAESLLNLTSFKRRVSIEADTVGGPIDVAVISKGDGFIWIKRKHYFSPDLNHNFFHNYNRR